MSELNENMGTEMNESAEDLLTEDFVEEPADDSVDIEDALTEEEGESDQPEQGTSGQKEPGYVRSRIDKAVAKAVAETEARMQARFDEQMAPYREAMLTQEAQELVRAGKVKDLETAKELVRYRQGQPQPQTEEQPRNQQGQFASRDNAPDPATQARINMLQHQADRIKSQRGIDVISEFKNNPEVKEKIVSGEMDFYDVAEQMSGSRKRTPAPMRSPNGASGQQRTAIEAMTDEQFDRLVKKVQGGVRYSQR